MRTAALRRLAVRGCLVLAAVVGSSLSAAADPLGAAHHPDREQSCGVQVQVDPVTRTVNGDRLPAEVIFRARVGVQKGWRGTVSLHLKGLPGQTTGKVTPSSLEFGPSVGVRTTHITVRLGQRVRSGNYLSWVVARCGKDRALDGFRIVVTRVKPSAELRIDPEEATVSVGGLTGFCITGARNTNALSVRGLPSYSSASFAHSGDQGNCMTMTVQTHTRTRVGDYRLTVTDRRGNPQRSVNAVLHVVAGTLPFTISGNLQGELYPGERLPLDLTLSNPNPLPLKLTGLTVVIDHLDPAHADACPVAANFVVTPFSGDHALVVIPALGSISLSTSKIPTEQWPQVEMLETDQNQDGCLGAALTFAYSGTAAAAFSSLVQAEPGGRPLEERT